MAGVNQHGLFVGALQSPEAPAARAARVAWGCCAVSLLRVFLAACRDMALDELSSGKYDGREFGDRGPRRAAGWCTAAMTYEASNSRKGEHHRQRRRERFAR